MVEDEDVVVAGCRSGLARGGVATATCLPGEGLTVGVLVGVAVVATGGVVVVVVVFCVLVCWPLLLFAPLRPARLFRVLVTGGAISVGGLIAATSVVGLPVICRGRRLVGGLAVAVVVEVVFGFGVGVGVAVTLAVLTGCERAGVGEGVEVATTALGLGSVVRAGVSRRALINSLS